MLPVTALGAPGEPVQQQHADEQRTSGQQQVKISHVRPPANRLHQGKTRRNKAGTDP